MVLIQVARNGPVLEEPKAFLQRLRAAKVGVSLRLMGSDLKRTQPAMAVTDPYFLRCRVWH